MEAQSVNIETPDTFDTNSPPTVTPSAWRLWLKGVLLCLVNVPLWVLTLLVGTHLFDSTPGYEVLLWTGMVLVAIASCVALVYQAKTLVQAFRVFWPIERLESLSYETALLQPNMWLVMMMMMMMMIVALAANPILSAIGYPLAMML